MIKLGGIPKRVLTLPILFFSFLSIINILLSVLSCLDYGA